MNTLFISRKIRFFVAWRKHNSQIFSDGVCRLFRLTRKETDFLRKKFSPELSWPLYARNWLTLISVALISEVDCSFASFCYTFYYSVRLFLLFPLSDSHRSLSCEQFVQLHFQPSIVVFKSDCISQLLQSNRGISVTCVWIILGKNHPCDCSQLGISFCPVECHAFCKKVMLAFLVWQICNSRALEGRNCSTQLSAFVKLAQICGIWSVLWDAKMRAVKIQLFWKRIIFQDLETKTRGWKIETKCLSDKTDMSALWGQS